MTGHAACLSAEVARRTGLHEIAVFGASVVGHETVREAAALDGTVWYGVDTRLRNARIGYRRGCVGATTGDEQEEDQ